jgi:hypothetical protein
LSENILDMPSQPDASQAPASSPSTDWKLDWSSQDIKLGQGRVATLRRPTTDEILQRDAELQSEIPIGRDGGYALPDPTVNEEVDAKYFDLVKVGVTGYDGDMPEQHKATAFNGLYAREIYVDEEYKPGDDNIPVLEEIGTGAAADFTVLHLMRQPTEGEIKLYRRKSAQGEIKPGKRGRQKFVTQSNLRTAMSFYSQWLTSISGATVGGKEFSADDRPAFIAHVDPLIQRQVVNAVVEAFTAKLSD